jgi:glycosyltransferase involved in cell wall biosynthesis
MTGNKLALLSHILPPSPSGQAAMLHRLLRALPATDYCLMSSASYADESTAGRLPARYHHLTPEFQLVRPNRFGLYKARELANILIQVFQRAKHVARIVKQERCGSIMACSGNVIDIPAGYLASRWARVPFYIYLFDDYLYQWTRRLHRSFVRRAERIAVKGAAAVIVPNEFLRDEYRSRYGIESTVIHNPYDSEEIKDGDIPFRALDNDVRIVYTGAVYHANAGAFCSLISAIKQLDRPNVKLHIYTSQAREVLEDQNIRGPIVYHEHVSPLEIGRMQREADLLFLPLSFNSGIPEVIKTSAPGKMGEYLASQRPILIHAPSDSFVSWYFRTFECGLVVDRDDPTALAQAVRQILDDEELGCAIGEKAGARAKIDFGLEVAQTRFLTLLEEGR